MWRPDPFPKMSQAKPTFLPTALEFTCLSPDLRYSKISFYAVKVCGLFELRIFLRFIYFWLCWVFIAAHRLSLVAASRGYSSLWCAGFSLRWLLLCGARALGARASVVVARGLSSCGSRALERRLSSCGARA